MKNIFILILLIITLSSNLKANDFSSLLAEGPVKLTVNTLGGMGLAISFNKLFLEDKKEENRNIKPIINENSKELNDKEIIDQLNSYPHLQE